MVCQPPSIALCRGLLHNVIIHKAFARGFIFGRTVLSIYFTYTYIYFFTLFIVGRQYHNKNHVFQLYHMHRCWHLSLINEWRSHYCKSAKPLRHLDLLVSTLVWLNSELNLLQQVRNEPTLERFLKHDFWTRFKNLFLHSRFSKVASSWHINLPLFDYM